MLVRFDKAALASALSAPNNAAGSPEKSRLIGVEGDPASTIPGGISETEAIISAAKRGLPLSEDPELSRISTETIEKEQQNQEPGPELDPAGLDKAKQVSQDSSGHLSVPNSVPGS